MKKIKNSYDRLHDEETDNLDSIEEETIFQNGSLKDLNRSAEYRTKSMNGTRMI